MMMTLRRTTFRGLSLVPVKSPPRRTFDLLAEKVIAIPLFAEKDRANLLSSEDDAYYQPRGCCHMGLVVFVRHWTTKDCLWKWLLVVAPENQCC